MSTELERLGNEKYVRLTTFRRDGRAVPTPVWVAIGESALLVWTPRDSGKVKRIRAGSPVEVTACDARGSRTWGSAVAGTARLLDERESDEVRAAIRAKYGLLGTIGVYGSMLRGGKQRTIGIAISLDGAGTGDDAEGP
ncbi:PPOX class F420-dependent oxidoreductase [Haloechinothrix sp. LS1_15]|uniref:PPOX class F420-dependent oxidoreductase n=1 Tax=Haloechinothrix sp. LS1_15 TaxID=2652248 RepID=UPI0029468232|nr:PPOX class F420-dependent oxidoreductase [Haloechinothrix sp. LS1_15]MDV6012684.1 PPOX class F420-dependent oxidoreductase [Haloechinothrix sp. LS1_15]